MSETKDAGVDSDRKGKQMLNWDKINEGMVSLDEYNRLNAMDSNAFWRLDTGHIQNVLEEAIDKIKRQAASRKSPTSGSVPFAHALFDHMLNEHGLTLVGSEIHEILRIAEPLVRPGNDCEYYHGERITEIIKDSSAPAHPRRAETSTEKSGRSA